MPIVNSEPSVSTPLLNPARPLSSARSRCSSPLSQSEYQSQAPSIRQPCPAAASAEAATRTIQNRLFVSHFLSTWNSRSFEFGATLFIAAAFPGSLLEVSVYAIARSAAAIVLSGAVGRYIDQGERLKVVRNSIVFQRLATILSCALFLLLTIPTPLFIQLRPFIFAALCLFACIEKLSSILNFVAVERDWVIVIASTLDTPSNEPDLNEYHDEDDVSEHTAEPTIRPIAEDATGHPVEATSDDDVASISSTNSKSSNSGRPGNVNSVSSVRSIKTDRPTLLSALNARLRRIDLFCKVAGPTVVALADGGLGSRAAIAATLAANLISLPVEYGAIARVYRAVPALAEGQPVRDRGSVEGNDGAVHEAEEAEEEFEHEQRQEHLPGQAEEGREGHNQRRVRGERRDDCAGAGATDFSSERLDRSIHRARLDHGSDREERREEREISSEDDGSHGTAIVADDATAARVTTEGNAYSQKQGEQSQSQQQGEEAAVARSGIDASTSSRNAMRNRATSSGSSSSISRSSHGLKASASLEARAGLLATNPDSRLSETETTPLLQSQNSRQERRYSSAVASRSQSYSTAHMRTQTQAPMSTTESSYQAPPSTPTTTAEARLSGQKPSSSCIDSIRASCFNTYASLRGQACIYLGSAALLPSLSLSLLYLNVLSFNGQTVTYLLSAGLTSWHVGLLRLLAICFEMSATWAGPWLAGRIGAVRAGMWFVNWQLLTLGLATAYFFPRSVVDDGIKGLAGGYADALVVPPTSSLAVPAAATGCNITTNTTTRALDPWASSGGTAFVTNGMSECSYRMLMTTMMTMTTTTGGWLQRAALAMSGFPDWYSVAAVVREGHRLNDTKQPSSPAGDQDDVLPLVTNTVAAAAAAGMEVAEAAMAAASGSAANAVCRSCIPFTGISSVTFDKNTPMLGGAQSVISATETASEPMHRHSSGPGTAAAAYSSLELSMFRSTPSAPATHSSVPPYPQALHQALKLSPSGGTQAALPEGAGSSRYPLTETVSMPAPEQTPEVAAAAAPSGVPTGEIVELAATEEEDLSEMRRYDGATLTGLREQTQLNAALVLVVGVILSRLGLWGFDLSAQSLVQSGVAPSQRGSFSTTEAALQNAFELMAFASTAIWNRPADFRFPVLASLVAIACSAALYAVFVRRRRGHLLHLPCGTVTIADGSKNNGERAAPQDHAPRGPR